MTPIPGAPSNDVTKGVHGLRDASAAPAPPRGKRPPENEFGPMLLLAGLAGLSPLPVEQAFRGEKAESTARATGTARARLDRVGRGTPAPGEPRTASSLAAEALARSQADELRTVGKGVSLSALAQAELRGGAEGPANAAAAPEGGDPRSAKGASDMEGPGSTQAPKDRAPGKPAADPAPTVMPNAQQSSRVGVATAAAPAASNALRALDRLSSAASRVSATQVVRGAGASAAPAFAGGVTASAKAAGMKASGAPASPGAPVAPARGVASPSPDARPIALRPSPSARTAGAPRPSAAAQAQFAAQVHRALGQALQARDGIVTIHLTPEHLGRLRVDLSRAEDGVSARFEAQTAEARGLLERSLPELKAALEARGLHVDRLDVRVSEPPAAERAGHEGEPAWQEAGGSPGQDGRSPEGGGSPRHRDAPEPGLEGRHHRDRPGAAESSPRAEPEATSAQAAEPAWGVSTIEFVV